MRLSCRRRVLFASLALLLTLGSVPAQEKAKAALPRDLEGRAVDPLANTNLNVLIFVGVDCPISNRYAPELKRLHDKFTKKGVQFWFVYPETKLAPDTVRRHVREYQLPGAVLLDPGHVLVKRARATVTPEAAVFLRGQLQYHGRIDDRYVAFGRARRAPTQHDLERVITAQLAGEPVPSQHQPAIGCYIPELP